MKNFTYFNPVKIVFGKNSIKELTSLLPSEGKIMFLYGKGSIKQNGVYDQVIAALEGHEFVEFPGMEANPSYETCMQAVTMVESEEVLFILAVGGGSVLDAAKFIAAAAKFADGDPWKILSEGAEVKEAIPLGSVLTLPATGSEMNGNSVISKRETQEKLCFSSPIVYPVFSILDPETSYSLSNSQMANGIVDAFVHVIEQYLTYDVNTPLQDRQAEAVILTLMEQAKKLKEDPTDYETRANIMWCATNALNGTLSCGTIGDWATHMIGHELTAFYGIDHARSLAIVLPSLWRNQKERKKDKLAQFGHRVFGIGFEDPEATAEAAITQTEQFFHSLGVGTKLADYGADPAEASEKVRERFEARDSKFGEKEQITSEVAAEILLQC